MRWKASTVNCLVAARGGTSKPGMSVAACFAHAGFSVFWINQSAEELTRAREKNA